MNRLISLAAAASLLVPVHAGSQSAEYWPEHAQLFRTACEMHFSDTACQCGLDRLAEQVGYETLAREIVAFENRFFVKSALSAQAVSNLIFCISLAPTGKRTHNASQ